MRAFIVRPFGTKDGIDFDAVQDRLIGPALDALGIPGDTTAAIVRAGNIREDMFEQLVLADIVIADVSIHNANVFYELGLRHAVRDRATVLVRADAHTVPFDILTDRYLQYDSADPAASVDALTAVLRATLADERVDSPVHALLPGLRVDPKSLMIVPVDFVETVERARRAAWTGHLRLLAEEAHGFLWAAAGLRQVAAAQRSCGDLAGAADTWERIREFDTDDVEANTRLATLLQKIGRLDESDLAISRADTAAAPEDRVRSELHALRGSNAKQRWRAEWDDGGPDAPVRALRSPHLDTAIEAYATGHRLDLNHYYSGLNHLALLTVAVHLARAHPDTWALRFEDDDEAEHALRGRERDIAQLLGVLEAALARARAVGGEAERPWIELSTAELRLLAGSDPARVAAAYERARAAAAVFDAASARAQLDLYAALGLRPEAVAAARDVVPAGADPRPGGGPVGRVLVCTGHRVDAEDRPEPRFPRSAEAEKAAYGALETAVRDELALGPVSFGIAGAASGADILFHEVCADLGVETRVRLALPPDDYMKASVRDAGRGWVARYDAVLASHQVEVLNDSEELPRWLAGRTDYTVWQRTNLWMLHEALSVVGSRVTVIALWNGEEGDGPGGTADLVRRAEERAAVTRVLDTNRLFAPDGGG